MRKLIFVRFVGRLSSWCPEGNRRVFQLSSRHIGPTSWLQEARILPAKAGMRQFEAETSVFLILFVLRTSCGWSWCEAMAAHNFHQPGSVRQTAGRCVDYLSRLAEIFGAYCSWRNHAERLYVLDSVVIEPVDGTAR